MASGGELKEMCSREVHQSKTSSPDDPGSACDGVYACARVCVGPSVWQTLGYIEGPEDVPWALASPSEGSPIYNRPA